MVIGCVRNTNLQLNLKKCVFGTRELKALGYLFSIEGVRPDLGNPQAVSKFPTPSTIKDHLSFLCECTYFCHFIARYSHIAEPLNSLFRDSVLLLRVQIKNVLLSNLKKPSQRFLMWSFPPGRLSPYRRSVCPRALNTKLFIVNLKLFS